jgi:hypothetical protein
MTSNLSFKKFSDNLTNSLTNVYRISNLSLVLISIGIMMILIGHFVNDWFFNVGILLTVSCWGFFIYAQLKGLKEISELIKKSQEFIDLAQETGIELTKTFHVFESLTISHLQSLNSVLEIIVPLLTSFPILGRKLNSIGMTKLQNVSHHLMDIILKADSATQNIENALLNADAQKLKIYTQNLREISQKLRVNTDTNLLKKEATL